MLEEGGYLITQLSQSYISMSNLTPAVFESKSCLQCAKLAKAHHSSSTSNVLQVMCSIFDVRNFGLLTLGCWSPL